MIKIGQKAPNFSLLNSNGKITNLNDYKGKKVILYFYPKDSTPGCTLESKDFSNLNDEFNKLNTYIFGISKDSIESHKKFENNHNLTVSLLSDSEGKICDNFGVWQEKSMFGKKYFGIVRSTFLIDENQTVVKIWNKVKVKGHAKEVLNTIKES